MKKIVFIEERVNHMYEIDTPHTFEEFCELDDVEIFNLIDEKNCKPITTTTHSKDIDDITEDV